MQNFSSKEEEEKKVIEKLFMSNMSVYLDWFFSSVGNRKGLPAWNNIGCMIHWWTHITVRWLAQRPSHFFYEWIMAHEKCGYPPIHEHIDKWYAVLDLLLNKFIESKSMWNFICLISYYVVNHCPHTSKLSLFDLQGYHVSAFKPLPFMWENYWHKYLCSHRTMAFL